MLFQFKRVVSIVLTICFLISISVVPALAASSDGSAAESYTAIFPSEEMQFMTSGSTPSTYVADDAGYSMTLNGVEQTHSYTATVTTTETAPSGYSYYDFNGTKRLLPDFTDSTYYVIFNLNPSHPNSICAVRAWNGSTYVPYYTASDNKLHTSATVYCYEYTVDGSTWKKGSTTYQTNSSSAGFTLTSTYGFWFSWPVKDSSGNLVYAQGVKEKEITSTVSTDYSSSFPSADYSNFSAVDRTLSLTGTPVTGEITGDQTYSFTADNPYIDVELPISEWVDEVPSADDYWSFSIDGTLSFDLSIGLQSTVAGEDKSYYALSDLVPSSWQLICNGALMDDARCSGSFDSVASTTDGYSASLTMSTGELNLGSVSSGEYGAEPETLGFRIYLTSASGGTETTITNSNTFESVTPYAYISFDGADGNSGLPVVTFYEDYASGDLSNGDPDDYVVSVNGIGFDYGYYITTNADAGKYFYGDMGQYPTIPTVSGYSYITGRIVNSFAYLWYSSTLPYWDGSEVVFSSGGPLYYIKSGESAWTLSSLTTDSFGLTDYSFIEYVNYNLLDSDGNSLISAMSFGSTGLAKTSMTLTSGGALDNTSSSAGYVSGYGTPITYASAGNTGLTYQFSNDSMTGYVDVTYPAETFGVISTEEFLSLAVSGNLAVRARVFPAVVDSDSGSYTAPYYIDNPTSVQFIFNDVIFSDEYALNYITDDSSVASVSGVDLAFDNFTTLDTVTFRFFFNSVDAQSSGWLEMNSILSGGDSFTIGADCEILTSPVFDAEYPPGPVVLPTVSDTMVLDGIKQSITIPVLTPASSGNYFYNGVELPAVSLPDGYSYYLIADEGTTVVAYTEKPYWDGSRVTPAGRWGLLSSSLGCYIFADEGAAGSAVYVNALDAILYSNFDILDESATVVVGAGLTANEGYISQTINFSYADMQSVSYSGRDFTLRGPSFTGDMCGDASASFTKLPNSYLDVNIPLTAFPVLGSLTSFDSVALSGDLTFELSVGFEAVITDEITLYGATNLVPFKVQVLYNGAVLEGFDQTFSVTAVSRSDDPYSALFSIESEFFDSVSLATNMLTAEGLSTIGFRIYITSTSAGEEMEIGSVSLSSVCAYAHVNFSTADGSNGLPTLILSTNSSGGSFDDSNIVEWLEKIHTELSTYLPEFSLYLQSIIEHLTAQTDVLNDILEAVKDNSAVESVSSTVTNIYNSVSSVQTSISNVETSISNVESTINNVSNTITEISGTVASVQQTQQAMQETQQEMAEDSSALRDVYASESDVEFKSATEDMSSGAYEALLGNSETGEEKLDVSDPKDLKNVGNKVKGWFSFDVSFSDLFDLVEGDTLSGWFSDTNASQIDSVVSIQTYGLDDDPYNHQSYDDYLFLIFSTFGGD